MENRPINPFRGLTPFQKGDRDWLFGRDKDVILMQSRIYSGRTTLLFAGSGVGKTSFLNAKIVPELEEQFDIFYHNTWSGGVEPLAALKTTISETLAGKYPEAGALSTPAPATEAQQSPLISALQISADRAQASGKVKPGGCLLILDQFEEVFQYHSYEEYFKTFLIALCDVINDEKHTTRTIFSMREEFLGELSVFDNRIPDLFNNYYRLKYPDQQGAQNIISRTCERAKVEIDKANLVQLVKDLSKIEKISTGALEHSTEGEKESVRYVERDIVAPPYLQIACKKLWERQFSSTNGNQNEAASFLNAYKPDDARVMLREFIGEKLSALNFEEQSLASRAFDFLVTKQGAKMAYELSQLAKHMGVNEEKLKGTLQKLSASEVRILRESGTTGNHWFELYHDMYGTIVDEWKEDYRGRQRELEDENRRRERKKILRVGTGIGLGLLLLFGITILVLYWRGRKEDLSRAKAHATFLESGAAEFEAREDRDNALLIRLGILTIKGLDAETEHRNRVEINRLISDDYPLLLATYKEFGASPTSNAMFSADGQAVLTQGTDGSIRLWETETGKLLNIPSDWTEPLPQTQLPSGGKTEIESRTGKQQTSAPGVAQSTEKRNATDQKMLNNTEQTPAAPSKKLPTEALIIAAVKHPKYQFLIAGIDKDFNEKVDRKIFIWRADNGQLLGEPINWTSAFTFRVSTVAFSPDGHFIAAEGRGKTPLVWKIVDDKFDPITNIESDDYVWSVVFRDSNYLLAAGRAPATIWDLNKSQLLWAIENNQRIFDASFSADGRKLLTLDHLGNIKVWDFATRTGIESGFKIPGLLPHQITPHFAADNETIIIGDTVDGVLNFWDAKTGIQRDELFRIHGGFIKYRVHPQAQTVLTLSDGVTRLWNLTPRNPNGKLVSLNEDVESKVLSLNGTQIITKSSESDGQSPKLQQIFVDQPQSIGAPLNGTVLSPDGSYSLSINESELNNIHVWDTVTNQEIARFIYRPLSGVDSFDVSRDRQFLYVRFNISNNTAINHYFMVLKINSADKSCTLLSKPNPLVSAETMVFSSDSKYLGAFIQYTKSNALTVWELPSMHKISLAEGVLSSQANNDLVFSNDCKLIAEVADNQAVIWELPTGRPLHTLTYSSTITVSKFSPDSKYFVTGYMDGTVIVWDMATAAQLSETKHSNAIQQIEFNSVGDKIIVATKLWVHLLSLSNNRFDHTESRMIEGRWIGYFRLLNQPGSLKIRLLLEVKPSLLKVQDIDFDHTEDGQPIEGDPQELLDLWNRKLNRKFTPGSGTTGGRF